MASLQQIIAALPAGKKNAMKVPAFEQAVGNQPSGTNNDQTRSEVNRAIYEHDIPIGSSSQSGYWLIDSNEEFQEVIDKINSTIAAYEAKRDALTRGWQRRRQSKSTPNPWPK